MNGLARKGKIVLLLVLTVVLLMIVSGRVSPAESGSGSGTDAEVRAPVWITVPPSGDPIESAEVPMSNIREYLPGVSLNDWNLRLVNNVYILNESFVPEFAQTRDNTYFDARAVDALEAMLSAAEEAGYTVCIRNAYRPYRTQAYLFFGRATIISENQNIDYAEAEEMARSVIAYPGTSEHQTGLCVDIMDSSATGMAAEEVEDLPVLKWLRAHCAEYGFIYRYPKEKQEITGWFEPWHFRYVGQEAAQFMMMNDLCLEEFYKYF